MRAPSGTQIMACARWTGCCFYTRGTGGITPRTLRNCANQELGSPEALCLLARCGGSKTGTHHDVLGFHDVEAVSLIQHGGKALRLRPGFKATVLLLRPNR